MTVDELLEHARDLQADLEHKRKQIQRGDYSVYARATLLSQINALQDRVDEIIRTVQPVPETVVLTVA